MYTAKLLPHTVFSVSTDMNTFRLAGLLTGLRLKVAIDTKYKLPLAVPKLPTSNFGGFLFRLSQTAVT